MCTDGLVFQRGTRNYSGNFVAYTMHARVVLSLLQRRKSEYIERKKSDVNLKAWRLHISQVGGN